MSAEKLAILAFSCLFCFLLFSSDATRRGKTKRVGWGGGRSLTLQQQEITRGVVLCQNTREVNRTKISNAILDCNLYPVWGRFWTVGPWDRSNFTDDVCERTKKKKRRSIPRRRHQKYTPSFEHGGGRWGDDRPIMKKKLTILPRSNAR